MKKSFLFLYPLFALLIVAVCIAWLPATGPVKKARSDGRPPAAKKKIIFIAGGCSHGPGEHEHYAGCALLADQLNRQASHLVEATVLQGWPADSTLLNNAAAIVLYMDGGQGHMAIPHLAQLEKLTKKGVGLTCLHYAVEVPKDSGGTELKSWIGGYFETFWSVNPHWEAAYTQLPKHPVTNGVKPFTINDEWYYHMRFRDNMQGVTPILTAVPPASTLHGPYEAHGNNEFVEKEKGQPQVTCWASEGNGGSGRGFGFTGGHQHTNWGNENFRKIVLNGIVWTAGVSVPKNGIATPALAAADLQKNLDQKPCNRTR